MKRILFAIILSLFACPLMAKTTTISPPQKRPSDLHRVYNFNDPGDHFEIATSVDVEGGEFTLAVPQGQDPKNWQQAIVIDFVPAHQSSGDYTIRQIYDLFTLSYYRGYCQHVKSRILEENQNNITFEAAVSGCEAKQSDRYLAGKVSKGILGYGTISLEQKTQKISAEERQRLINFINSTQFVRQYS